MKNCLLAANIHGMTGIITASSPHIDIRWQLVDNFAFALVAKKQAGYYGNVRLSRLW
jgi:hypothetical protein